MRLVVFSAVAFLVLVAAPTQGQGDAPADLMLSEFATDPQQDHDGDGRMSGNDEYVELFNPGPGDVDVSGWSLVFNDTTPTSLALSGHVGPGERRAWLNAPGEFNNHGHLILVRPDGSVADEVRFGTWPSASAPTGDATGLLDEARARIDGEWRRFHATPGDENQAWGVRHSTTWSPSPIDGWVAAGANGTINATLVHAERSLVEARLWLDRDGNRTLVGRSAPSAPNHLHDASVGVVAPASNASWVWELVSETDSVLLPGIGVRIDGAPPVLPPFPARAWSNRTEGNWTPPAAFDEGVGRVEWQWEVNGTALAWSSSGRVEWSAPEPIGLRARARDALGFTTPWGPFVAAAADFDAPTPVSGLRVEGEGPFRVAWDAAADNGSGIGHVELRRDAGGRSLDLRLESNAASHHDDLVPDGERVLYSVRAADQAGNIGPWRTVEADYDARHPRVVGIRLSDPHWSKGSQEIRIDFDRSMDTSRAPRLVVGGQVADEASGRFFANRTTYFWSVDSPDGFEEGTHRVRVEEAWSRDGAALGGPASSSFVVDRSAPVLHVSPGPGWTNATRFEASVDGEDGVSVRWRWWREGEHLPAVNVTASPIGWDVPAEGDWAFRVQAVDRAGNRGEEVRGVLRVDRSPPQFTEPEWDSGAWTVPLRDEGSGVDWSSARASPGWDLDVDVRESVLRLRPHGESVESKFTVHAVDFAGNAARTEFRVEPPATSTAHASSPDPGTDVSKSLAQLGTRDSKESGTDEGTRSAWWLFAAVVLAAVGGFLAWRWRAVRTLAASFAARLRAARERAKRRITIDGAK